MYKVILIILAFTTFSFVSPDIISEKRAVSLYESIGRNSTEDLPDYSIYKKAVLGYNKLKAGNHIQKDIITIVDFRRLSTEKRLWVIDLSHEKVLFHTLVAHGKFTGENEAKNFSNIPESKKSSLGFYITDDTYFGKHGLSLNLIGMEKGFNDNAKKRRIVMHGAEYVNNDFIKKNGRLGRSFGCPAVPVKLHKEIISVIKGQSCLFIYYPDKEYEEKSILLNTTI